MFIGPSAQTFNPALIVGYGPQDALPRNEISDAESILTIPDDMIDRLQPVKQADGSYKFRQHKTRLDQILQHDALYAAYPGLRRMPVTFRWPYLCDDPEHVAESASYTSDGIDVVPLKSRDIKKLKGSLMHEIEHAIQDIEGFAPGTNIRREIAPAAAILHDKLVRFHRRRASADILTKINETYCIVLQRTSLFPLSMSMTQESEATFLQVAQRAIRRYFNNAGEIEARSADARMNMTADERVQTPATHLVFKEMATPRQRSYEQDRALTAYQHRAHRVRVNAAFNNMLKKFRLHPVAASAHKP